MFLGCHEGLQARANLRRFNNFSAELGHRKSRVFVVVARQEVIDSRFSSVTCAPVYSAYHGLTSQVAVGIDQGLKHDSAIHCDELISLPKSLLTDYVGSLSAAKIADLNRALAIALELTS